MFCHRYPIGACVTGNGEVRSLQDNVALDCQHQGGRELGLSGVVNPGESLKSVVTYNKPKMLTGLNQKVCGQAAEYISLRSQTLNHRRNDETSSTLVFTRNVVSPYFSCIRKVSCKAC